MTHHQFGTTVGDSDIGGFFEVGESVLMREYSTVAVGTIVEGQQLPVVALQMSGRVNKTQDTLQVVWLLSPMDAGAIAAELAAAADRTGSDEAIADFMAGFEHTAAERSHG